MIGLVPFQIASRFGRIPGTLKPKLQVVRTQPGRFESMASGCFWITRYPEIGRHIGDFPFRIWLTLSGYRQHVKVKHLIFRCQRILLHSWHGRVHPG
jgi:hypothetical protein